MVLGIGQVVNSLRSLEMLRINGFNDKIMKIIVKSSNFQFLTNLILEDVNLEHKDIFQFPIDKQLSLEELSLAENFISEEGINHLSKIKMDKLRSLNLYLASLASNQAVDSLLRLNLSKLERINIGFTSISSENALRVISALNLSKLTHLNITYNNFDVSFYKGFSELKFASLQSLDISNLLINEDAMPYLKQLKFPELTRLSIGKNQIFVDNHYTFLNKKNYPKLINLSVNEVVFSQQFFRFFANEFDQTLFQQLEFVGQGVKPQIFYYLKLFNMSQLRKLVVNKGHMKTNILYSFLENSNFEKLQEFKMEYVTNSGSIMHKILQKVWPSLKILRLGRVGRTNFTLLSDQTYSVKFPKLQLIALDIRGFNSSQTLLLIEYLSRTCLLTLKIEIIVESIFPLIQDLANKHPMVKNPVYIELKIYETLVINTQANIVFACKIQKNQNTKVYIFEYKKIAQQQSRINHTKANFDIQKINSTKFLQFQFYYLKFDFNQIEILKDFGDCQLFKYIKNISKSQNGKCIFPYMKSLMLEIANGNCYKEFSQCKFPNLNQLSLKFQHFQYFTNNSNESFIPQNLSQISEINFEGLIFIPNDKVIEMFKRQNLYSIQKLTIIYSDLQSDQINQILIEPGIQRIRNLSLFQVWVDDLNFIKDNDLKLRHLDMSAALISPQLYQLSNISYQFITYLRFNSIGLTDPNLLTYLQKKTESQGNTFPKLQKLILRKNNIQQKGLQKLTQMYIPYLNEIFLIINKNPQIINQIFGSSFHRINNALLYWNMQDNVDFYLDGKSTRELQIFYLFTEELRGRDFQGLGRLDFWYIREIQVVFTKYYQCENLIQLLKIAKSAIKFIVIFKNPIQLPLSQCLSKRASPDQSLKNLLHFQLYAENCFYSNMRRFFDHVVFQQTLQVLVLIGVYPSQKSFQMLIQQSNLDHLNKLTLRSNDLSDDMVHEILDRDLREINIFNLGLNEKITSQAISKMSNRTYPTLIQLLLDSTQIDDSGISTLVSCQFPVLQKLDISNTQITSQSLDQLSRLSAPNLNKINLSNNNLLAQDLYRLNTNNFVHLKQIIIYPSLRKYEVDLLLKYLNKDRSDSIQIVTDLIHEQQIHYHQQGDDEIFDDDDNL